MKHNYTALDSAILEALKSGPKKFRELENEPEVKRHGVKLAAAHNAGVKDSWDELKAWHFISQSLDELESKGQIQNGGNVIGWSLKEQA